MILTATINEVKRRILFDNPQAVVAVKGDYEVNGVAFAFPAIYEDDFDLSTAVKTVFYKATDGIIYNHIVTETDTDTGYPLWVFKDEINKGAFGDVEFALVCDKVEGGNIVKRWVSMITTFRVQKTIEIDESAQEDNEQTYSERLAYLMTQMANMQATVSGLASGAPTPVSLASAMTDTSKLYVYTGSESGYTARHWYYYNGSAWTDGGLYGGIAIDDTLTSPTMAAPASEVGQIKEDLSPLYSEAVYQYTGNGNTGFFITGGATREWSSSSITTTLVFRIPKGTKSIKVDANADQTAIIAFLQTYVPVKGEIPDWAVEYPGRITINAGESITYDVYTDTVYMYVLIKDSHLVYHTPTLTFTYPTDLPLASLDDTSDRSTEINLLLELFGKCTLTKGTYYVSGIVMPDSTALIGTPNSIVRLLDSVTSGAAITMSKNSLVQGVFLEGGLSTVTDTEGTRYGIEWTGNETITGFVDDCIIRGFDGAGILLHDTTQKIYRNLLVANCHIRTNFIGIDIKKNSEFNRITNCNITANYYGIRNRGGNNHVDNCGIDSNIIGIQVDADEGTNGGHGGISNCTINHSDHNNGYGIIIKDTGRMLVSGCNLYYSKIKLENTDGNVINACGFGQMAGWEITDGSCNIFTGCMIRSASDTPITITNNAQTKVVNCYTRDGATVTV